ncbi:DUF6083 domain-containing protein [Streptomyces sp. NPDC004609]|uniref:DUF6083 domain-containing protein n=1 Tax=Streptomyces sp. NPDC004609 TaxID=3364704 RepID=UPI00369701BB
MRSRGRINLMAMLCDGCWNVLANELAEHEGATAPPRAEPDPDDVSRLELPVCPECGGPIRLYPTNYDRWVSLAMSELPATEVPSRYRWRLVQVQARNTTVITDTVAVRIKGVDPLLGNPVIPAHQAVCPGGEAEQ